MRDGAASETARRVASKRLDFARVPAPFGNADADDALQRDVAGPFINTRTSSMTRYLEGRTAFFDRVVVSALERGVTQVVVAAAGYDGRALRYAKPGVRWFELDHPDTQRDKLERLQRLGIDTSNITFVAADFAAADVGAALRDAGVDASVPSLLTAEGVAVYLDPDVLAALLRGLRDVAAAGTRLAISLSLRRSGLGRLRQVAFAAGVASLGEPVRTVLTPEENDVLLAATGWAMTDAGSDRGRSAGLVVLEPT